MARTPALAATAARRKQITIPDTREYGLPGTKIFAGQITEDPNTVLNGSRGLRTFQQMGYEPTCAAMLAAHVLPLRSTKWYINPVNDNPDNMRIADFVHHVLWEFGTQSFDDIIRQQLEGSLKFGFAASEIMWDVITDGQFAGKWGWERLAWRSQLSKWRWEIEQTETASGGIHRELLGMVQLAAPTYQETIIPRNKMILHVNEMLGENFDGTSLFRPAYLSWMYLTTLRRIQAIGLERGYMGIPDIIIPEDWTDQELTAATQLSSNIRTHENAGMVHPAQIQANVIQLKLEAQAMTQAIADHRRDILLSRLTQFLDLGSGGGGGAVGSYALSEDQSNLFLMSLNGVANYFEQEMNLEPGITQLVRVNFPDVASDEMPRLVHGDIGQYDLDRLGRFFAAAGQWGFLTPDDPTEDKLREMLDLPERDSDLSPESLRDLVEKANPTEIIPGRKHSQRPPAPQVAGTGHDMFGRTIAPPAGAPATPPPPTNRSGGQPAPRGVPASPQQALQRQQMSEAEARMRWERPHGRLDDVTRNRIRASEFLLDALSDLKSRAPGMKPDKPSIRAAKMSRPYVIQRVQAAEVVPMRKQTSLENTPAVVVGKQGEPAIRDLLLRLRDRPVVPRPGGSTGSRSPVKFTEQ